MEQANNNIKKRKGKHLKYEDRIKIEALYQMGLTPSDIGKQIRGKSRRTIANNRERINSCKQSNLVL